jgi:hypothetical protein
VGETIGRCLSGALGIEPHWAEEERWSTAGFTESSALSEWPRDTFDTAARLRDFYETRVDGRKWPGGW